VKTRGRGYLGVVHLQGEGVRGPKKHLKQDLQAGTVTELLHAQR